LSQGVVAFLQIAGIIESGNSYFAVSGFVRNPGLAGGLQAMAFVASLMLLHSGSGMKRWQRRVLIGVSVFLLASIFVTTSRAAILSAAVGAAVVYGKEILSWAGRHKKIIPIVALAALGLVAGLYFLRPDSARARLLVWTVSEKMIAERPWFGFGTDGFRHNYMMYQAGFFKENPDSAFASVAGNAAYPYNDFIRLAVEFGVPAALAVLCLLVLVAVKTKDKVRLGLLASYCTFALFSYPSYCLPLLVLFPVALLCCLDGFRLREWPGWALVALSAVAAVLLVLGDSSPVRRRVDHPNYEWWAAKGDSLLQRGDIAEAEHYLVEAGYMVPRKMRPDFLLWKLYRASGDSVSRIERAESLLKKAEGSYNTFAIRARAEILEVEGEDFLYRKFLLDNLKYHNGWENIETDPEMEVLLRSLDSLSLDPKHPDPAFFNRLNEILSDDSSKKINGLSDSLLRTNIAQAAEMRAGARFCKGLSEPDFMEMLLPFVCGREGVQADKRWLRAMLADRIGLDSLRTSNAVVRRFRDLFSRYWFYCYKDIPKKEDLGLYSLFTASECYNTAAVACDILRACGVPCVLEFTPKWPDRRGAHYWCAAMDSTGVLLPFTPPKNAMLGDWDPYIQGASKVYRLNFSVQKEAPLFLARDGEYVPPMLRSPLISDQTWRYHKTADLTIPFRSKTGNKLAWLCHFSESESALSPVAWGVIDHRRRTVTFKQVPAGVVFFPVFYDGDEPVPFGAPFTIPDSGRVRRAQKALSTPVGVSRKVVSLHSCRKFRPFGRRAMVLSRKYPDKSRLRAFRSDMVGTVLLGGNGKKGPFDTLARLGSAPEPYLQDLPVSGGSGPYRFYLLSATGPRPLYIAHVEFLGEPVDGVRGSEATPLPVFSPSAGPEKTGLVRFGCEPVRKNQDSENAVDGNMETFSRSRNLMFDFGQPVSVCRMRFAPRNANNIVNPGDTYCLYYYDEGWQEHSRQVAEGNYLVFKNVPKGTLYWLSDETRGREELPFRYVHGRQVFIDNYQPGRIE